MINKRILIALTLCLSLATAVLPAVVQAQGAIDITVSPPTAYMKVKPGSNATHTVVIENLSAQQLKVTPKVVDFTSDNQTGIPRIQDETTFPYFDFDAQSLEPLNLPPRSKAQLSLKIAVPSGAPTQEFPMTILFESQPNSDFSLVPGSSQVRGTIGSNLILLVSQDSDVPTQLEITSFKTSGIIDTFRPLVFTPVLANQSYAATAASGSATITNWQGTVLEEFELRPVVILGNTQRELETPLSDEQFTSQFRYKPLFLLGIYKITVDLVVQSNGQPVHLLQTKTVLAIPFSLLAALVAIPLLWWLYTYFLHKNDT